MQNIVFEKSVWSLSVAETTNAKLLYGNILKFIEKKKSVRSLSGAEMTNIKSVRSLSGAEMTFNYFFE